MKGEKKAKKIAQRDLPAAAASNVNEEKRKAWDPEPASFEDGVALIESLFGGDGDGETFSAFIQCVKGID